MRKTLVLKCLVKYGKDFHTMTFSLNDIFSTEKNSTDGIYLKDCARRIVIHCNMTDLKWVDSYSNSEKL